VFNTNRNLVLISLILILGLTITGCSVPSENEQADETQEIEKIVIGALYPLSGALASTGIDCRNGVELAVDIVNNKYDDIPLPLAAEEGLPGLNGAKVEVIFGDHQGSPEKGLAESERLYVQGNAVAVIGCYNSGVTATASQVAERLGRPFINGTSSSPTLNRRNYEWFFRVSPDDTIFIRDALTFVNEQSINGNPVKDIAIVSENTLFGQDCATLAREIAKEMGFNIVADIVHPQNTNSLISEVQKLKNEDPDFIIHTVAVADGILTWKTFKEQDYSPKGYVAVSTGLQNESFLNSLEKDGEYAMTRAVWSDTLTETKPVSKVISELYKNRYGRSLNDDSGRAFVATMLLMDAINRAGSVEPEAVRTALRKTDVPSEQIILGWEGIKFDETGQNVSGKTTICQIIDGQYQAVWPKDITDVELIYPIPSWSDR